MTPGQEDTSEQPKVISLEIARKTMEQAVEAPPVDDPGDPRDAEDGAPPPADNPESGDPSVSGGRRRRSGPLRPGHPVPAGFPITPLGISDDVCFYLDASRQLRHLKARDHSRLGVEFLFGNRNELLVDLWPKLDKEGNVTGWRPDYCASFLMAKCAERGIWDPFEKVRGPGAWRGPDGELLLHCGDRVWKGRPPADGDAGYIDGEWLEPDFIGRNVYPAAPPTPRPSNEPATGDNNPAAALFDLINTWSWKRGETDAMLLLGHIGAARIGGALKWRPLVWVTGGKGTGKSTLHDLFAGVFDEQLISLADTSEAGVRQTLGHRTLPVTVDELEAEADNNKAQAVIRLARLASSGGRLTRGGQDHKAVEFIARSCFMFSSILVPPLTGQDRSRMAILELGRLPENQAAPKLDPRVLREIGAALTRRLVDGWSRFEGLLEAYRQALAAEGHPARGCDQFGTLLACADMLLHDGDLDRDYIAEWAGRVSLDALDPDGDDSDEMNMLGHLLSSQVDAVRGGMKYTVAQWILDEEVYSFHQVRNRMLGVYGLKVLLEDGSPKWLALANKHQGLAGIFAATHWAGRSGTTSVWVQAAQRLPGAEKSGTEYFGGVRSKCTKIPIELCGRMEAADTVTDADDAAGIL